MITLQVCWRCNGTGIYQWGACINGKMQKSGDCFKCVGGGEFPRTNGAAWYTRHGKAILASIEHMVQAGDPNWGTEWHPLRCDCAECDPMGLAEMDRIQSN
jgi:hypothetical protein